MRTYSPKAGDVVRKWHVIDAQDVVLGRLATHAATLPVSYTHLTLPTICSV